LGHKIFRTIDIKTRVQEVGPQDFAFGEKWKLKSKHT